MKLCAFPFALACGALPALTLASVTLAADADERRTGYEEMSAALQAMQDDATSNPGVFWLFDGETLWNTPAGDAQAACADCHGDAETSMAGIAARYPAWDETSGAPVDLVGRIGLCRTRHQQAAAPAPEDPEGIALSAFVTHQSRGMSIAPDDDPRLDPWRDRGRDLFNRRMGQLDLSCATCHDDNAGERLAAARIPQAHPTGYPQYRLEWETMGTLQRRFDNCLFGVRAERFERRSPQYVALELYMKERARGLAVETLPIRP